MIKKKIKCEKCKRKEWPKKKRDKWDKEWKKTRDNSIKYGLGMFDMEHILSIDPSKIAFSWPGKKKEDEPKLSNQTKIVWELKTCEQIYKKKFGKESPFDLELFKKDEGLFVERMIRAVEICTLKHILDLGGGLNINVRPSIIKGRRGFMWEG